MQNLYIWNQKFVCVTNFGPFGETIAILQFLYPGMHGAFITSLLGIDARKPVFGGLRATMAQTSLRIRTD